MNTAGSAQTIGAIDAAAPVQSYVINLVASTSPMALSHPSSPELKRFTFFVSRQREDGRERFRLHMGYFATQDEAEALLESVRDVYPAAWAGPAPTTGMGRRGRIAPGSVVVAAPAPAAAPVASVPVAASALAPAPAPAPPAAAPAVASRPAQTQLVPAAAIESMSNVRDVLAQLSEPAPALPQLPDRELSGAAALHLLEDDSAAPRPQPATRPAEARAVPAVPAMPPLESPFAGLENEPEVRLVTPEDTQTLTDIKLDRQNNAPPCFAVQLIWSVSPIEISALPHLAIFDAYTLYNVEGNRQGRKWFGLRLGFFTDPNSASQVANYVRSEYKAVAVVPVAVKERDRARGSDAPASAASTEGPQKTTDNEFKREPMAGFELLTDDRPVPARRDFEDAARGKAPGAAPVPRLAPKAPPAPGASQPSGGAAAKGTGKRVVVRRRPPAVPPPGKTVSAGVGGAEVLESTLEILGASTLSLDEGGREVINDAAARKPARKPSEGTSRFSKLLSRLSGG